MPSSSTSTRSFAEFQLRDFLRRLASSEATPGGGSAAALAGALAASLVTMVGTLTTGRKGFEELEETLELLVEQGEQIAENLTGAIDRDAAAFDEVMAAFKLPKATEEEKAARAAAIQAAMKHASEVPMEVAEECLAAAELALVALEKGTPSASSDAAVGLLFALTGLEGAVLNVATNLDGIKDAEYVAAQQVEVKRLLERSAELRTTIWEVAKSRITSLA